MPKSKGNNLTGDEVKRSRFLLELYQKALLLSEKELNDYFLDYAVSLTGSTIGFFHFVSDDQKSILLTAWNGEALKNCVASYSTHYPIDLAGNWVDCVRSGHPVIYNDYEKSPNQRGVPEGHVSIKRFMSIPIFEDGKVEIVFGVGNKTDPYNEDDVVQLLYLANELSKIYKQRRAENILRESEKKYRSLFENMLDGFAYCRMIFDKKDKPVDFVYLEINDAFERLTGLKREAVVGKRVTEAIPGIEKANPELFEIYGRVALTCNKEKFEIFFKPLSKWFSISVYCPEKGYFAAIFEDNTKRKRAEMQVETLARFPSENPYAVLRVSFGFNILYANPASQKIVGLVETKVGKSCSKSWEPYIKQALSENKQIEFEEKYGKLTYVFKVAPIISERYVNIYGIDITERKKAEEALEEYQKNLEKLVEERTKQLKDSERLAAIGATAGMVGHDIRNPLQAITSDIFLAKTDLASTPECEEKKNIQESIEEIEKNVSYINKIVADLQDFARPLTPKLEETDLEQTIHFVLSNLNIPRNVIVKYSVRKGFPKIRTDQTYLKRILTNLANNGIQAMPNGGKLTISAVTKDGRALISIEDNGEGMPESVRSKIFTPLVTTKSKGQGFGLSVVKRFTDALNGTVTFESEVGKGTKFMIELPV